MNYKNPMVNLYGISDREGKVHTRWQMSWFADGGTIGLHSIELDFQIIQITDYDIEKCVEKAELVQFRIRENFDEFKVLYQKMIDIKDDKRYSNIVRINKYKNICDEIKKKFCE